MRTLYFDCFAGASGNMILGALFGLGVDRDELASELSKLDLPEMSLKVTDVERAGIAATHVEVVASEERAHRHFSDIKRIIGGSRLDDKVKAQAISIFLKLSEAEAKVHGIAIEQVHFHEVGAIDAIADIVGACIGFNILEIEQFACSKINVGSGFVEIEHGTFPVPPPAVAELLIGVPIYSNEISGELITPTAAAIITTVCKSYGPIPQLTVERSSYGAGTRTYDRFPNVLRLFVGEAEGFNSVHRDVDNLFLLETNLDDISPQVLGFVMERAFELGALDCWFTSIQMKKDRPGTMVSVLCSEHDRGRLSELIYSETTTLGIRVRRVERECLERESISVKTRFGEIDVKVARIDGKIVNAMPEYDHVRRLAIDHKVPFRTIQEAALRALDRERGTSAK